MKNYFQKHKICFIILLIVLIISLGIKPYVNSGNTGSRLAPIQSIVEEGMQAIDNTLFVGDAKTYNITTEKLPLMRLNKQTGLNGTNDKVFIDGKFYSDKPIIVSALGVPCYAVMYNIFGLNFTENGELVVWLLTFILAVIPTIILLLFFNKSMLLHKRTEKERIISLLIIGLATFVLPYSTSINNHIITASAIMVAIYNLQKIILLKKDTQNTSLIIGLSLAVAAASDLVAGGIFITVVGIYFITRRNFKELLWFIIGILPIILLHLFLTVPVTGDIFPGTIHPEYWEYDGSSFNKDTLSGTTLKHESFKEFIHYFFHMLFGNRGLFSYTPILLIGLYFLFQEIKKQKKEKILALLILISSFIVLTYYILMTNNYAGWAYGIRWFVPLIPGFMLFGTKVFDIKLSKAWKIVLILIVIWSLVFSLVGMYNVWTDMWRTPISFINNLVEIGLKLKNLL